MLAKGQSSSVAPSLEFDEPAPQVLSGALIFPSSRGSLTLSARLVVFLAIRFFRARRVLDRLSVTVLNLLSYQA
jgi:hypothetical protein